MNAPKKMTQHTLNALKGWPSQSALDYSASLAAGYLADTTFTVLPEGSVVHLNSTGYFEPGIGTLTAMPLFTFQSSSDPDVMNYGGTPATDIGAFVAVQPSGVIMALVATGAYELVSTNVDLTNFTSASYPPNTPLTSVQWTGTSAGAAKPASSANPTPGTLKPGTLTSHTICGIVSRGIVGNGYLNDNPAYVPTANLPSGNAVAFWTCFIPAGV